MVLSGGGPGLLLDLAVKTNESPDGTAFTFALYHPVAPPFDVAISTTKTIYGHIKTIQVNTFTDEIEKEIQQR